MRKYRLGMIGGLVVVAVISMIMLSGCQNVFYKIPGLWTITVTYDRGEFTMEAEFFGDNHSGEVVIQGIAQGEYTVDGNNVTFSTAYNHTVHGQTTDHFIGIFDSGISMSGTGTVIYHDENRQAPLTWRAVKLSAY